MSFTVAPNLRHFFQGAAQKAGAHFLMQMAVLEQVEVIDLKRRAERYHPTNPVDRDEYGCRRPVGSPDRHRDRPPLPEDGKQKQTGLQHVDTALAM
jgi:hypothetical protein